MWSTTARWRTICSVFAALLAALALAGTAQAGLPGVNGRIAFHSDQDGDIDIYRIDSGGGGLLQLTNNPATDGDPGWSPDGSTIAFATNRDGNYEIYKMSATGTSVVRLTNNAASDGGPSWSPDGTQIVYTSNRDGNYEIYKMNADGSAQTRVTTNAVADDYPAWSPTGTKIAYQSATPNLEIFTMNTDGSGQVNVTNNAANDTAPNWSPNGAQIAFTSYRSGNGDVYKMNADGSGVTAIESSAELMNSPAWAPQGDSIVVSRQRSGNYDLFMGPQTANAFTTPVYTGTGHDEAPDWQPVNGSYARPKGASPLLLPLVPAYKECIGGLSTHRGLNKQSCYTPKPESSYLQVGTPDYNGAAANSVGSLRITVLCTGGETPPCLTTPGDQLDGQIQVNVTDVRCRVVSGGCTAANADYTGEAALSTGFRVTDKNNGPTGVGPSANGTTIDFTAAFSVPCSATSSTAEGATCSITTTLDSVLGSVASIAEGKRGIWQLDGEVLLYDGGQDGDGDTIGNTLFMTGGLFFP